MPLISTQAKGFVAGKQADGDLNRHTMLEYALNTVPKPL